MERKKRKITQKERNDLICFEGFGYKNLFEFINQNSNDSNKFSPFMSIVSNLNLSVFIYESIKDNNYFIKKFETNPLFDEIKKVRNNIHFSQYNKKSNKQELILEQEKVHYERYKNDHLAIFRNDVSLFFLNNKLIGSGYLILHQIYECQSKETSLFIYNYSELLGSILRTLLEKKKNQYKFPRILNIDIPLIKFLDYKSEEIINNNFSISFNMRLLNILCVLSYSKILFNLIKKDNNLINSSWFYFISKIIIIYYDEALKDLRKFSEHTGNLEKDYFENQFKNVCLNYEKNYNLFAHKIRNSLHLGSDKLVTFFPKKTESKKDRIFNIYLATSGVNSKEEYKNYFDKVLNNMGEIIEAIQKLFPNI